jgi:hypothetical protein
MTRRLLIALALTGFAHAGFAADGIDIAAYGKCTEAGRAPKAAPAAVLAACKGIADQGVPAAQYLIGMSFLNTDGFSSPEAAVWLQRAATLGNPPAQTALAIVKLNQKNEKAIEEGRDLLRRAACNGTRQALDLIAQAKVKREQLGCDDSLLDFNGTWQADLTFLKTPPSGPSQFSYRVVVEGTSVRVLRESGGEWSEVKPGKFTLRREGQTAIVTAIDSGWDFDGQWIETWTFHLLRTGEKTAFTNFVRTVNNPHLPVSLSWRAFAGVAEGVATRN